MMNKSYTKAEKQHLERIKSLPCVVCGQSAPSDAHHVKQDSAYHCVPLCKTCHQDGRQGIHGQRFAWKLRKLDEYDALAKTIEALME